MPASSSSSSSSASAAVSLTLLGIVATAAWTFGQNENNKKLCRQFFSCLQPRHKQKCIENGAEKEEEEADERRGAKERFDIWRWQKSRSSRSREERDGGGGKTEAHTIEVRVDLLSLPDQQQRESASTTHSIINVTQMSPERQSSAHPQKRVPETPQIRAGMKNKRPVRGYQAEVLQHFDNQKDEKNEQNEDEEELDEGAEGHVPEQLFPTCPARLDSDTLQRMMARQKQRKGVGAFSRAGTAIFKPTLNNTTFARKKTFVIKHASEIRSENPEGGGETAEVQYLDDKNNQVSPTNGRGHYGYTIPESSYQVKIKDGIGGRDVRESDTRPEKHVENEKKCRTWARQANPSIAFVKSSRLRNCRSRMFRNPRYSSKRHAHKVSLQANSCEILGKDQNPWGEEAERMVNPNKMELEWRRTSGIQLEKIEEEDNPEDTLRTLETVF